MFTDREILVVEAEFLIALEIQRILEEAHAARMVFARSSQEAEALAYRLPQYDLVIVELILGDDASERFARQALQAGAPLVLTGGSPDGAAAFPGVPFVSKPFTEATLLAAAAAAFASRRTGQDGQPGG